MGKIKINWLNLALMTGLSILLCHAVNGLTENYVLTILTGCAVGLLWPVKGDWACVTFEGKE